MEFPKRYIIVILTFLCTNVCYIERLGFSIAYTVAADAIGVDQSSKGLILSTFYWGYVVSQIPGGWAAQKIGGRRVLLLSFVFWSLTCALIPLDPKRVNLLVIARLMVGIAQGFIFPSIHTVLAQWVPPHERSRSVSLTTSGMYLGAASGMLLLPSLVKFKGPQSVFLVEAALGGLWSILWVKFASDPPRSDHPKATAAGFGENMLPLAKSSKANAKAINAAKIPWTKIFFRMSSRSATGSTRNIIDWNADRTNAFIDVCVENIASRRHRVAEWYEEISATFSVRTGVNCNSGHIKNKFDNMRSKFWNAWNQLLQISGGYWNEELDTVGGSDEWWATVPSECRRYKTGSPARFRELDVMFSGCMETDKCQFIIPPQPPVGLAFETQIIGDYLRGDTEGISSRRGPRQHNTGASSSTSEYDRIISTCMEVQQEGDDYEEWEVTICASRCAEMSRDPLAALLHKPSQLRRAIIHFVNRLRRENL